MNTRNLTELGYLLFLDRYAKKDGDRSTLKVGDIVLIKVDNQKVIGTLQTLDGNEAIISVNDQLHYVAVETVDKPLELDPKQMWERTAEAIASAETSAAKYEEWIDKFNWLLDDWKFLPGGRIFAGAGTHSELTLYNCYVIPSPKDSKDEIFKTLNLMAQIMSRGGGVGINISSLRPRHAYAKKTNGRSSGAVSWGELYSYTTGLIEQAGSRRGALMLILNDWHPDILEFINAKRDGSKIINANISVGISDEFMQAVENNADWELKFPDTSYSDYDDVWHGNLQEWVDSGRPVKIWHTIKAVDLWNAIINSAWACAEPGIWFSGRANAYSNSQYYALLVATNPCGEQPLPPNSVCLLGAINLSKFVMLNSHGEYVLNTAELETAINYAVRFLDNVIDVTPYITPEIEKQQKSERRIGLGTMGLAELLIRLKIRYGSDDAVKFVNDLYSFIAITAYEASAELAKEKGAFPLYDLEGLLKSEFIRNLPVKDELLGNITQYGLRNVTLLTQAPTGTIGTMVNTSTGIEPFYYWSYVRKGRFGQYTEKVRVYEDWCNNDVSADDLPDYFVTAQDLSPNEHVRMQAVIQRWVDSSISKTCNVPNDYTVSQVGELYKLMYDFGCKGGTVYRDGSRSEQVLNLVTDKPSSKSTAINAEPSSNASSFLEAWRKRPDKLDGTTYHKQTPVGTAYITINHNGDEPFEVFVNIGRAGSDIAADAEGVGRLVSLILRMPSLLSIKERIENIAAQLGGIGSGRSHGFGKNRVMSLPDAISQVLVQHSQVSSLPSLPETLDTNGDVCPACGNYTLQRIEGCKKCFHCGHSEC